MGEKSMYLTVPRETTDEQLVKILEKVLPDHLINIMHINPVTAKTIAPNLAQNIVYNARQCNQAYFVPDVATRLSFNPPSKEECDAFKTAIEEIVVIRYGEVNPMHRSSVQLATGKLWIYLRERVLGLPPEKDDLTGNAAVGVRG